MKYKIFQTGPLENNCSVIYDENTRAAAVIDPGDASAVKEFLKEKNLKLEALINTHNHGDHIGGNAELKKQFSPRLYIHKLDAAGLENEEVNLSWMLEPIQSPPADVFLSDGDEIKISGIILKVIHTPGHTPGSICLDVVDEDILIAGDFLFYEGVGRTDLPGGSSEQMAASLKKFFKIFKKDKKVITGHGPLTTIQKERLNNNFV